MKASPHTTGRSVKAVFVFEPEEQEWSFWGFDWNPSQHRSTKRYCRLNGLKIHVVETCLPDTRGGTEDDSS